jgi:translation initiation factor SUI1
MAVLGVASHRYYPLDTPCRTPYFRPQGIGEQFDKKRIVKALKKQFACNGTVIEHPEYGEVIQLQGDQVNE